MYASGPAGGARGLENALTGGLARRLRGTYNARAGVFWPLGREIVMIAYLRRKRACWCGRHLAGTDR